MSAQTMSSDHPNPYAAAAHQYWDNGWRGIVPVPYGRKKHPLPGYTGHQGRDTTFIDIQSWIDEGVARNICLRLPRTMIGIDVDHYADKIGGDTLTTLETQLGPLPPTWRSTSRDDGISGIRIFRLNQEQHWPDSLGNGIDIVQHRHRYVMAAPSLHPNGTTYKWITPDGAIHLQPPHIDNIPALPDQWQNHFGQLPGQERQPPTELTGQQAGQIIANMPDGEPCHHITTAAGRITGPGQRHDLYTKATLAVANAGRHGCPGAAQTLTRLRAMFIAEVGPDRGHTTAKNEFDRSLTGALAIIADTPQGDTCTDILLDQWLNTTQTPHTTANATNTHTQPDTPTHQDKPSDSPTDAPNNGDSDFYQRAVQRKALDLQIIDDARRYNTSRAAANNPPPHIHQLGDFLTQPDNPTQYLIDQLWPAGGRVMLSAAAKSGKTTLICNLIRSLADADPFLDHWPVNTNTNQRILLLNMELNPDQIRRWLRNQHIHNHHNVAVANLRGKANTLGLDTDTGRDRFINWIGSYQPNIVILDPLAPLLAALGIDENDNYGVAQFFNWWNTTLVQADVTQDLIAHHTGRATNARSRGAARFDDEPDSIWTLIKRTTNDNDDDPLSAAPRVLKAYGRDVELGDTQLAYQPDHNHLTVNPHPGATKTPQHDEQAILAYLTDHPHRPITRTEIAKGKTPDGQALVKGRTEDLYTALKRLHDQGRIIEYQLEEDGQKYVRIADTTP